MLHSTRPTQAALDRAAAGAKAGANHPRTHGCRRAVDREAARKKEAAEQALAAKAATKRKGGGDRIALAKAREDEEVLRRGETERIARKARGGPGARAAESEARAIDGSFLARLKVEKDPELPRMRAFWPSRKR